MVSGPDVLTALVWCVFSMFDCRLASEDILLRVWLELAAIDAFILLPFVLLVRAAIEFFAAYFFCAFCVLSRCTPTISGANSSVCSLTSTSD